jgi:hypothetical protein
MTELLNTSELPHSLKRYVVWARESAAEIISVIADLLKSSRSRLPQLECRVFDVASSFEGGLAAAGLPADGDGSARPSVRGLETLPKALWGDPQRIGEALSCLVRAAAEAMPAATVVIDVRHEQLPGSRVLLIARLLVDQLTPERSGLLGRLLTESLKGPGDDAIRSARRLAEAMDGGIYPEESNGSMRGMRLELFVDAVGPHALEEEQPAGVEA